MQTFLHYSKVLGSVQLLQDGDYNTFKYCKLDNSGTSLLLTKGKKRCSQLLRLCRSEPFLMKLLNSAGTMSCNFNKHGDRIPCIKLQIQALDDFAQAYTACRLF